MCVMCKKIQLTVLSGMLATLVPSADAKISRCEDDKGHVTFSDTGCESPGEGSLKKITDPHFDVGSAPLDPSYVPNKTFFYCRSGTKKYTKC